MSLANFIPTVWSARIQRELEMKYVYGNLVNRDYEGDISAYGDKVNINSVGDITVRDYVKYVTEISPDALDSDTQQLVIDQSKYFAFLIDDIDSAQTKPKVMTEAIRKSSRALAGVADEFVRDTMIAGAGLTDISNGAISLTTVAAYMGSINQALDEADNDPDEERFIVVPAWLKKLIVTSFQGNTQSTEVQANGRVGRYYGLNVLMSNNTAMDGTDSIIIAGTRRGMTMAEQIVSMEAYRPETSFSDAVKGLHLYGGKVVESNALLTSTVFEEGTGS